MESSKSLAPPATPPAGFDAVCRKMRAAIMPTRAFAVSVHDQHGNLLWLSESSMGPDEHNAVREACVNFAKPDSLSVATYDLGGARSAVLFRVRSPEQVMVGAAMLIVDSRIIHRASGGAGLLMTPKLLRALGNFASMRRPAPAADRARAQAAQVTPEIDRLHAALRRSPIALRVQRLMPLAMSNQLIRYEVLLRSKSDAAPNAAPHAMLKSAVDHGLGSMIDRRVVAELIGWLIRHPLVWRGTTTAFSINLTKTALHDEHFMKFVGLCLDKASLRNGTIGFEIDAAAAIKLGGKITDVAAGFQHLGCPLILDDFLLHTDCFDLLRLPGVEFIKMAPSITAHMPTDQSSQAAITALVRTARVHGVRTVAKGSESRAEQQWLTALGVDFVQSNALSAPVPLASLAG